jgi:hypothetical protein
MLTVLTMSVRLTLQRSYVTVSWSSSTVYETRNSAVQLLSGETYVNSNVSGRSSAVSLVTTGTNFHITRTERYLLTGWGNMIHLKLLKIDCSMSMRAEMSSAHQTTMPSKTYRLKVLNLNQSRGMCLNKQYTGQRRTNILQKRPSWRRPASGHPHFPP